MTPSPISPSDLLFVALLVAFAIFALCLIVALCFYFLKVLLGVLLVVIAVDMLRG